MELEWKDRRLPPPALLRRLAAHRKVFAVVLGDEFPQALARTRSRVSGHMWRLGSEEPFVAAIDLARMSSAQEDPQVPMLLVAALDMHEARMEALAAAVEALVSECTLALRASVRQMLSAWNPDGGFVAASGKDERAGQDARLWVADQSRYLTVLARAYELSGDACSLAHARALAEAFRGRFIDRCAKVPALHEMVQWNAVAKCSLPKNPAMMSAAVQALGMAGLVAWYRIGRDPSCLEDIRALHAGFIERFQDADHGGFFERADRDNGEREGCKSYASVLGLACSYLLELSDADSVAGAPDYGRHLLHIADVMVARFLDEKTGFLFERFEAAWTPQWRGWHDRDAQGRPFTIGRVGHNMRAAWFLLRMLERTGTQRYGSGALQIMSAMLAKGFDWVAGGMFDCARREETDPSRRWVWGRRKAWWHQADAIRALLLARKLGLLGVLEVAQGTGEQALEMMLAFWTTGACAPGSDHDYVLANGAPVQGTLSPPAKAGFYRSELLSAAIQYAVPHEPVGADTLCGAFIEGLRRGASIEALRLRIDDMFVHGRVNHPNAAGLTPVMLAAAFGRLDVVCALEAQGAALDAVNEHTGEDILYYAAMAEHGGEAVRRYITSRYPEIPARADDCAVFDDPGGMQAPAARARRALVSLPQRRARPRNRGRRQP